MEKCNCTNNLHKTVARSAWMNTQKCVNRFEIYGRDDRPVELCLLPGVLNCTGKLNTIGFMADEILGDPAAKTQLRCYDWIWDDFVNLVKCVGIDLRRIIIQNKIQDPSIFDGFLTIGRTIPALEHISKRVKLSDYCNVMAYDRTRIIIEAPWKFKADTYLALNIPKKAHIGLEFVFEAPSYIDDAVLPWYEKQQVDVEGSLPDLWRKMFKKQQS